MSLDDFLRVGEVVELGSYHFEADAIMAFARKYDPQPFHVDAEAARNSVLGGLCASGWHTCAVWMKLNLEEWTRQAGRPWNGSGPRPVFGPSPGFSNLKWLRPVYAGDTITYTRRIDGHRKLASRPGWRMVSMTCGAFDQEQRAVLTFESAVLLQAQ